MAITLIAIPARRGNPPVQRQRRPRSTTGRRGPEHPPRKGPGVCARPATNLLPSGHPPSSAARTVRPAEACPQRLPPTGSSIPERPGSRGLLTGHNPGLGQFFDRLSQVPRQPPRTGVALPPVPAESLGRPPAIPPAVRHPPGFDLGRRWPPPRPSESEPPRPIAAEPASIRQTEMQAEGGLRIIAPAFRRVVARR